MKKIWIKLLSKFSAALAVVIVEDGKAKIVKGDVPNNLLSQFSDVAKANKINAGLITIAQDGQGIKIRFCGIPNEATQQQFRNIWFSQPNRRMTTV